MTTGDTRQREPERAATTELALDPGAADVVARAWDSTGALQPQLPEHVWNPKGYVNNSWAHAGYQVS